MEVVYGNKTTVRFAYFASTLMKGQKRTWGTSLITMSILLSLLGVTIGQHCAVYREIAPCTCRNEMNFVSVACTRMQSFGEAVLLLQNRFAPTERIRLAINASRLEDLSQRSFRELNMTIVDLKLQHSNLSDLSPYTFSGLTHVQYFSLADNPIPYMPIQVFEMMPGIKTLDIGRMRLRNIPDNSFQGLPNLETLVLPSNALHRIDSKAMPSTLTKLHLARNGIKDLNGTLRHIKEVYWLFLNENELTSLDGQLPSNWQKIRMIHANDNRITKLPKEMQSFENLNELFFMNNSLESLDGALSRCKHLKTATFENNRISILLSDDFTETESLKHLNFKYNNISELNTSLLSLRKLEYLTLAHNSLEKFSWQEVKGLQKLRYLDLSCNKIRELKGSTPNLIEWDTNLRTLLLDNNELHSLNGGVSGLRTLLRLNVSYNYLTHISPDDLIGLDQLTLLDISHNRLTTLEETSRTFLPMLEELIASFNYIETLGKDFHGLPVLCWANLSNNNIKALRKELGSKTRCKVRDGVHDGKWSTLRINLGDNPVLCDENLAEILSELEANHTKIMGSSHCNVFEEQQTESPLVINYVPASSPLQNVAYNAIPDNNNLRYVGEQFVPIPENRARHNHRYQHNGEPLHVHIPIEQPDVPNIAFKRSSEAKLGDVVSGNVGNVPKIATIANISPMDSESEGENHHFKRNLATPTEVPVYNQPIYTNIDPAIQERQISQLATEIEQLRNQLEELTSENRRLAQNLQSVLPDAAAVIKANDIIDTSRPILPLEQLIILSTEKPPNFKEEE